MILKYLNRTIILLTTLTLVACGGGGGGGGTTIVTDPPSGGLAEVDLTQPNIEVLSNFKTAALHRFSTILMVIPIQMSPVQYYMKSLVTLMEHLSVVRRITWYRPGSNNDPLDYFAQLRTTATTPSGA